MKKDIYNPYSQRFNWFNIENYYPKIANKFMNDVKNRKITLNIMLLMFPTSRMLIYDLLFKKFIKKLGITYDIKLKPDSKFHYKITYDDRLIELGSKKTTKVYNYIFSKILEYIDKRIDLNNL